MNGSPVQRLSRDNTEGVGTQMKDSIGAGDLAFENREATSERKRRRRQRNGGLRKVCGCPRRQWAKCLHSWYLNFKPRHGQGFRFSLDAELGTHIASKTKAEEEAEKIRAAIRKGTYTRAADRIAAVPGPVTSPTSADAITFDVFAQKYIEGPVKASGKKTWGDDAGMMKRLGTFVLADGVRLGDKAIGAITEDDIEAFYADLRRRGQAASTCNHYVQVIKAVFRWGTKKAYLARNPISEDAALKRTKIAQRSRRLAPDVLDKDGDLKAPGEERRLLAVASPGLQRLIIAALETCCRRGELLQPAMAGRQPGTRRAPDQGRAREGRGNTRAADLDAAGGHPGDGSDRSHGRGIPGRCVRVRRARPTDDRIQEAVGDSPVLKAHGYKPTWVKGGLSSESRAQLKAIDLHFHDLRHEAGSPLHEKGWPIHHVKEMLGHATISQTDTYLNAGRMGLHDSMERFGGKLCKSVAKTQATEHQPLCNDGERREKQPTVN
jgi:integrase